VRAGGEVTLQGDGENRAVSKNDLFTGDNPWLVLSGAWPWEEGARDQQQREGQGAGKRRARHPPCGRPNSEWAGAGAGAGEGRGGREGAGESARE